MAISPRTDFRTAEELCDLASGLGLDIRLQDDLSPLGRPVPIGALTAPNSLAIHPMEGCDATPDGTPGELTTRRYQRYSRGGAGLIWFEATAAVPEGRSNANQLWFNQTNLPAHARLVEDCRRAAKEANGSNHDPVFITQLTHSGRLVKRDGRQAPVIAVHNPYFDAPFGLPRDYPVITDDQLQRLEEGFVQAAKMAWQVGFHGVDVKSCHRYLIAELLTAHTRPGKYGGSFENRTRFLLNIVDRIHQEVPGLMVTLRLNGHDGPQYPYAWGMGKEPGQVDLTEPIRLVRMLYERGVRLVSISIGRRFGAGYGNPGQVRPGAPAEHPLYLIADHIGTTRDIQQGVPEMVVMGTAYSWFRQFFPNVAAASLQNGWATMVGLGRQAYAYPDFARHLLQEGRLEERRVCTACGRCAQLLEMDAPVGCVVRDAEVYVPIFKQKFTKLPPGMEESIERRRPSLLGENSQPTKDC